jgi:acyl-CoA synthetase (AMP-forming)/AMP-acid ligase II
MFLDAKNQGSAERRFLAHELTTWTYQDMDLRWREIAAALGGIGVSKGDRVVTSMPQSPEALAVLLAVSGLGASFVPLVPASNISEVAYFLEDSQCSVAVMSTEVWNGVSTALEPSALRTVVLTNDDATVPRARGEIRVLRLDELTSGIQPWTRPSTASPDDEMAVLYTSGSTARPKGVIFTHRSVVDGGPVQAAGVGYQRGMVLLGVMPLYHAGGLFQCLAPALAIGGALMLQTRFSVRRFWRDVAYSGATGGLLMDAMIHMLLTQPATDEERESGLREILSQSINREAQDRFGFRMHMGWGLTETTAAVTMTDRAGEMGYVGEPIDRRIQLEIRDENEQPQMHGRVGEIWCRHPWMFAGYLNDGVGTALALKDGWVRSGDLGFIDDDSGLHYVGRLKRLIKRSGESVSALEVEQAICTHPAVLECVCLGVADPIRVEEIKAVIVLRPGEHLSESDLVAWCMEHLAPFKIPRYIEFREKLPLTHSAKPDIQLLVGQHATYAGWDREARDARGANPLAEEMPNG